MEIISYAKKRTREQLNEKNLVWQINVPGFFLQIPAKSSLHKKQTNNETLDRMRKDSEYQVA
ncbi:hypothetical protein G15_3655 [Enterococcus avium]|uniref:hypothetical protein n=1 Tax=Enterococcus malodoratus TaxID=71451 RepID=UPI0005594CC2|nr:hypothetical protein [Enterococcus malodoratus]BBM19974.1 hypothetical protein G15_3655 [Enterococcus avium]